MLVEHEDGRGALIKHRCSTRGAVRGRHGRLVRLRGLLHGSRPLPAVRRQELIIVGNPADAEHLEGAVFILLNHVEPVRRHMLQVHALRLKLALEGGDVVQTGRVIFFGEHHRAPSGRLPHRLVHYLRAQIEQLERVVMVRPAVGRLREFGLDGRRNAFGQSSLLELGDTLLRVQVGVDCTFQHKGLTGGIRLRSIRLKLGDVEGELVRERLKRKHVAGFS
mmetsp:Transcript_958/g.2980  ORF Transcript_958/g.2980 Transcript_958/m.2980 type:complete len:221 (+) Transcript_958:1406-2068(+)